MSYNSLTHSRVAKVGCSLFEQEGNLKQYLRTKKVAVQVHLVNGWIGREGPTQILQACYMLLCEVYRRQV